MIALVDMDGVLVDFIGGICKLWNLPRDQFLNRWEETHKGHYDVITLLNIDEPAFWERIDAQGVKFWTELAPLPWCQELWRLAHRDFDEVHIATAPSLAPCSTCGKIIWLKEQFGKTFNKFMLGSAKHLMADEHTVLIDDRAVTGAKFMDQGGIWCTFPQPWNTGKLIGDQPFEEWWNNEMRNLADAVPAFSGPKLDG